jgi:ubiquinone/menaquinone biosynthesis C-methylase UbiE
VATAPDLVGVVADATSLPLEDKSVDGVVCSQVIENPCCRRRATA